MKFNSLGLSAPILKAVESKGYLTTTPIQEQIIPSILMGNDVLAAAQTGTGKTAGFTLPLLEILSKPKIKLRSQAESNHQVRALILTPTRELAAQVASSVEAYGENLELSSMVVFGGVSINPQIRKLKSGVDILIATPGRLLDLYRQGAVKFSYLEILVLDEADRMLDMGFIHDIKKIIEVLPKQKQSLMFSATFSQKIKQLARSFLIKPIEVEIAPKITTAVAVKQWLCPVDKKQKPALLVNLIQENKWHQVLVFSKTKHGANKLVNFLEKEGINAMAIHGNKSQAARTKALAEFKNNKTQVLVATDIAARGLDINLLPYVVNFDLPQVPEDYVHRIGRTGRANASGEAVSLVCADEFRLLSDIEKCINKLIPRVYIDNFHPVHDLPASCLSSFKAKNKANKSNQSTRSTEHVNRTSKNAHSTKMGNTQKNFGFDNKRKKNFSKKTIKN